MNKLLITCSNYSDIDVVFHLSALVHQMGGASASEYEKVNVTQTLQLAKRAKDESLSNISFLDPVDKKLVPKLLDYADVLLLIQGNVQWGSSNKLYDYLVAKKPIITSLYVKHNDVVEDIGCGYSSEYDNSDDMVENIEKIYNLSDEEKKQMGEKAYIYVSQNHDIKLMAKKLESLCKEHVSNA